MYHFIVNQNSRSGKGNLLWNSIFNELNKRKVDYEVYFTEINKNGMEIAREITENSESCNIIAIGGDGTVNEVINGIKDFNKVTFSYIPTGSSNDFAKGLGFCSDPVKALDNILNPKNYKYINIGSVSDSISQRYFLVSCGIGFDADVCFEALNSTMKKKLNVLNMGKLTYVGIAFKRLLLSKMVDMDISIDNKEYVRYKKVFFVATMNLPYQGGGLKLCPEAVCDDDILDVCITSEIPKIKIFTLLPTAYKGKHTKLKGVHIKKCQKIDVRTNVPLAVHVDGEKFGYKDYISVSYNESKLKVVI